jgi:hypothetical protein
VATKYCSGRPIHQILPLWNCFSKIKAYIRAHKSQIIKENLEIFIFQTISTITWRLVSFLMFHHSVLLNVMASLNFEKFCHFWKRNLTLMMCYYLAKHTTGFKKISKTMLLC